MGPVGLYRLNSSRSVAKRLPTTSRSIGNPCGRYTGVSSSAVLACSRSGSARTRFGIVFLPNLFLDELEAAFTLMPRRFTSAIAIEDRPRRHATGPLGA